MIGTPENHRLFWMMAAGAFTGCVIFDLLKALWDAIT